MLCHVVYLTVPLGTVSLFFNYHSLCRKGISPECIFIFFEILNFLFPDHGFKMLVGKILSQLAPSEKVTCDMLLPSRLSRSKIFPIEQRNDFEASHRACI